MPIISPIQRDTNNNVSIVRMISSDSIATVKGSNYILNQTPIINELNGGTWQWYFSDMVLCYCSDGSALFQFTDSTFSTLKQYGGTGGGGSVTPADIQEQTFVLATATGGSANAYTATMTPPIAALADGLRIAMIAPFTNTNDIGTVSTLAVDALPIRNIYIQTGDVSSGLPAFRGSIQSGLVYYFTYNSSASAWMLENPSSMVTGDFLLTQYWCYGVDSGTANAYAITLPTILTDQGSATLPAGSRISFTTSNANTGASTITVDGGLTTNTILLQNGAQLQGGEILTTSVNEITVYGNGNYVLTTNNITTGATSQQIQQSAFNYAVDTGITGAAFIASLSPAPVALTDGLIVNLHAINNSIGPTPTFDLNGLGPHNIINFYGNLAESDIQSQIIAVLQFSQNSNAWVLLNPASSLSSSYLTTQGQFTSVLDTGAANAYVATPNFFSTIDSIEGIQVFIKIANTNTGASTLDYGSLGAIPITYKGNPLIGGELLTTLYALLVLNKLSNRWELMNSFLLL